MASWCESLRVPSGYSESESLRVPSGYSESFGTNGQHRGLLGGVHLMILELESVLVRLDARVRVNFCFRGAHVL